MSTLVRPKSPRAPNKGADKEESFWDKIGTLGRKKRMKEGKLNKKNNPTRDTTNAKKLLVVCCLPYMA